MPKRHGPGTVTRTRRLATVLGAILAMATLGAAPALAQPVECGTVLTQDTTLTANLDCPEAVALVIGADGITVDLGGYAVGGPVNLTVPGLVGIDNSAGHDDVTIRNGTIQNVGVGVQLTQASRNRLTGLVLLFDDTGVRLDGGSGNRIEGNELTQSNENGIEIRGLAAVAAGNVVADNLLSSSHFRAVEVAGGTVTGTVIERNSLTFNGSAAINGNPSAAIVVSWESGDIRGTRVRDNQFDLDVVGIVVGENATGTLVERNQADRVIGDGVQVYGDDTTVRLNRIVGAGIGVRVEDEADGIRITGNRLLDSWPGVFGDGNDMAIQLNDIEGGSYGILIHEDGTGGSIRANRVRSAVVNGIQVRGDGFVVSYNLVTGTDGDGIRMEARATGSRVERNLAADSKFDGITVENPDTTVTANTANDNGELGIEAVQGVVDGGGNRARGNGDPRQCVGVTCR